MFVFLLVSTALSVCSTGQYDDSGVCRACVTECVTCFGGSNLQCDSCRNNTFVYYKWTTSASVSAAVARRCQTACPTIEQYPSPSDNSCYQCNNLCVKCSGGSNTQCTQCYTSGADRAYLHLGSQCWATCPNNYYGDPNSMVCRSCDASCSICREDLTLTCLTSLCYETVACLACNTGYNLAEGFCPSVNACLQYATYTGGNPFNAAQCQCISNYYKSGSKSCTICDPSCKTCTSTSSSGCATCWDGGVLLSSACTFNTTYQSLSSILSGSVSSVPAGVTVSGANGGPTTTACGYSGMLFGYGISTTASYLDIALTGIPAHYALRIQALLFFFDGWPN
jgi:hypothetical protein